MVTNNLRFLGNFSSVHIQKFLSFEFLFWTNSRPIKKDKCENHTSEQTVSEWSIGRALGFHPEAQDSKLNILFMWHILWSFVNDVLQENGIWMTKHFLVLNAYQKWKTIIKRNKFKTRRAISKSFPYALYNWIEFVIPNLISRSEI